MYKIPKDIQKNWSKLRRFLRTFKQKSTQCIKIGKIPKDIQKKLVKIGKIPNDIQKNGSSGPSGEQAGHLCPAARRTP